MPLKITSGVTCIVFSCCCLTLRRGDAVELFGQCRGAEAKARDAARAVQIEAELLAALGDVDAQRPRRIDAQHFAAAQMDRDRAVLRAERLERLIDRARALGRLARPLLDRREPAAVAPAERFEKLGPVLAGDLALVHARSSPTPEA